MLRTFKHCSVRAVASTLGQTRRSAATAALPRLAASAVVCAPQPNGAPPLLLFLRRHDKARFLKDTWVFPGGCVEPSDFDAGGARPRMESVLGSNTTSSHPTDSNDAAVAALSEASAVSVAAACRELSEEAGIVLGRDDELLPLCHWVTPASERYRYNTRCVCARIGGTESETCRAAPAVTICGKEIVDYRWLTAADAVAAHYRTAFRGSAVPQAERLQLPLTTLLIVEWLATFGSWASVAAALSARPCFIGTPTAVLASGEPARAAVALGAPLPLPDKILKMIGGEETARRSALPLLATQWTESPTAFRDAGGVRHWVVSQASGAPHLDKGHREVYHGPASAYGHAAVVEPPGAETAAVIVHVV